MPDKDMHRRTKPERPANPDRTQAMLALMDRIRQAPLKASGNRIVGVDTFVSGVMSRLTARSKWPSLGDALASAQGHVVTRWIGADLTNPEPHVMRFEPPGPGVLLLCSDGLWNYQPDAARLAELALPAALTDPLSAARTLTSFALDAGGMDNVTVVLAPFPVSADPMPRRRQQ